MDMMYTAKKEKKKEEKRDEKAMRQRKKGAVGNNWKYSSGLAKKVTRQKMHKIKSKHETRCPGQENAKAEGITEVPGKITGAPQGTTDTKQHMQQGGGYTQKNALTHDPLQNKQTTRKNDKKRK